jgi:hypothetical protein
MIFQRTRQLAAVLAVALLLTPSAFAFELPLSSEAVREAYFLGQRHDEKTAKFLDTYRQHLPAPKCGPHVATVELVTPYAEVVDLSRQHGLSYSAQQAEQEYRRRSNSVRIGVHVLYPGAFGSVTPCSPSPQSGPEQRASVAASSWRIIRFACRKTAKRWNHEACATKAPVHAGTGAARGRRDSSSGWSTTRKRFPLPKQQSQPTPPTASTCLQSLISKSFAESAADFFAAD